MRVLVVALSLALLSACATVAQVDLKLPTQAEREIILPGGEPQFGARLYRPEGAGPFPAAVLSHTCGPIRRHILEWAQRFQAAGYVVLAVDHLGPRNLVSNCNPSTVSVPEYGQDSVAALKHLRSLPFVDGKRIVLMGISYGAMAGLRSASETFRARYLGNEQFSAIIGLYPWCNQQFGPGYYDWQWNFFNDTTTPLLVVLGADDEEADPRSCVEQAKENASKGMPVEYRVLAGTTHGFDHSVFGDQPFVFQRGNRTLTYRYNRKSVEATWELILDFIARRVGGSGTR